MNVGKTLLIKAFEEEDYVGFVYIVEAADLTVIRIADEKEVVRSMVEDPRKVAEAADREIALPLFEYAIQFASRFEIADAKTWLMSLYSAAILLNNEDPQRAREWINRLPEEQKLYGSGYFKDSDFLLLGDLYLIFGEENRAFASWAYGMQVNPYNQILEERFRDYSKDK